MNRHIGCTLIVLAWLVVPLKQAMGECNVSISDSVIDIKPLHFGSVVAPATSGASGTVTIDLNGTVELSNNNYHPGAINLRNDPVSMGEFKFSFRGLPENAQLSFSGSSLYVSDISFRPNSADLFPVEGKENTYQLAAGITSSNGKIPVTFVGTLEFKSTHRGTLKEGMNVSISWSPGCQ